MTQSDPEGTKAVALTENVIKLCGRGVIAHLNSDDQGGVFAPVEVEVDGGWENGCILTLQDRAVIAWFTGTLKIETFEVVVPYAGVKDVFEIRTEKKTWRLPERVTLGIDGAVPATIKVLNPERGWHLPRILQGVLMGHVVVGETNEDVEAPTEKQ